MVGALTMESNETRKRVAVVGAGISGITAAYLLGEDHDVTLFEKEGRIGGHTHTVIIPRGPDEGLAVDTGFIVCNPVNYPKFYRLLDVWGVPRRDAEMSFSCYAEDADLHYRGPDVRDVLLAPRNLLKPRFLRLLLEQRRFNQISLNLLANGQIADQSLGDFVKSLGLSSYFVDHYLVPLAASIWSSPDAPILSFPAITFLTFFRNHGMLELHKRPQWQTVVGGSHAYLKRFRQLFRGRIEQARPVTGIRRGVGDSGTVVISCGDGDERLFDAVVVATHADEALRLLKDASPQESAALGSWEYHNNHTWLHVDESLMPPNRRLWASWNYVRRAGNAGGDAAPIAITYSMNRLQGLRSRQDYFVTLNPARPPRSEAVFLETTYTHPQYTAASVRSQQYIRELQGDRNTYFCGAYMGYGFHEDGVCSALEVVQQFVRSCSGTVPRVLNG
jgi:predicted NAD/FAD-binding protein